MVAAAVRSGWVPDLRCRQTCECASRQLDGVAFSEVEKAVGRAGLRDSSEFQF